MKTSHYCEIESRGKPDFKRYTRKAIVKAIKENPKENLLALFKKAADESSNVNEYKFWRHDNHPIEIWSNKVITEKTRYIHNIRCEGWISFAAGIKPKKRNPYISRREFKVIVGML